MTGERANDMYFAVLLSLLLSFVLFVFVAMVLIGLFFLMVCIGCCHHHIECKDHSLPLSFSLFLFLFARKWLIK